MPQRDDGFYRARFTALFDKLLAAGWITEFSFHEDGKFAVQLTEKGKERVSWIREIDGELKLGPDGMMALRVMCLMFG